MRRFWVVNFLTAALFVGVIGAAKAQTVQLPTFNSFSVNTSVSVPDAGIVTPGGIRRTGSAVAGMVLSPATPLVPARRHPAASMPAS